MADKFGGVRLSEIEAASRTQPFPGHAGASPLARFVHKISSLVSIRKEMGEMGGVSVFLQSHALETDVEGRLCCEHPLLATGNEPIQHQVWLANAVVGTAYALQIDCTDAGTLVRSIRDAGLGSLPAVFVDWRGAVPVGRLFLQGVSYPDAVEEVKLVYAEIDIDDLKGCLDNFYRTTLQTPFLITEGHGARIWKKPSQGHPEERPEERIQGHLIDHLRSRYTRHVVRAEVSNEFGRCDLVIYANLYDIAGEKFVVKEWILELKALTDRTSEGESVANSVVSAAIEKGVRQAVTYREKEHARKAALCCYDMRAQETSDAECFAHVAAEANDNNVLLWRWYLFRSAEAARRARR